MTPANVKRRRHNKVEYKKYQSSTKRKKYRAGLNRYARKHGIYGERFGKHIDVVHHNGHITGIGSAHANRAAGARAGARKRKRKG